MAPDETSTTSAPRCRCAASPSTSAPSCASSTIPSGVVSELEPTLTTILAAVASSARRASALPLIVLGRGPLSGRPLGGQLVAGLVPRGPALRERFPLGLARGTLPLGEPDVGAARA